MDWTQILITVLGSGGILSTYILPRVFDRANKRSRDDLNTRLDTVEESIKSLCSKVDENHITTQGLHLLDVIEHRPHCWETIRQMFVAYSKLGGNGHVQRVYQQWENDYGRHYDAGEVPPLLINK